MPATSSRSARFLTICQRFHHRQLIPGRCLARKSLRKSFINSYPLRKGSSHRKFAVNLAFDLLTFLSKRFMDPSSYPPALEVLLPPAKLIIMVFAAYPLYVCWWKARDALGDGFQPSMAAIFSSSEAEEPPRRRFKFRSLLIWGVPLILGFTSFGIMIADIGITFAARP